MRKPKVFRRRRPDGTFYPGYHIYYRDADGRQVSRKASDSEEEAEYILAQILADVAKQKHAQRYGARVKRLPTDTTLTEVRNAYLRHVRAVHAEKPQTVASYQMGISDVMGFLAAKGITRVAQVDVGAISVFRDTRLSEPRTVVCKTRGKAYEREIPPVGPRTVNVHVGAFKSMLRWAAEEGGMIQANPIATLKPLEVKRKRKQRRAMSVAEKRSLLERSPEALAVVWYVFLHTGLREQELAELTWDCVDLDRGRIIVPADFSKNSELGYVPVSEPTWDLLARLHGERLSDGHVFLNPLTGRAWRRGALSRAFNRCLRDAKVAKQTRDGVLDVHALRTTYITDLVRAGNDVKTVQRLARHKHVQVTLDYYARHGGEDVLRSAAESIAMRLPGREQENAVSKPLAGSEGQGSGRAEGEAVSDQPVRA